MTEKRVCATLNCNSTSFSYELDAAGECCNECGAVLPNTTEFEVLGRVLEADRGARDEEHSGRMFIRTEDTNLSSNVAGLSTDVAEKYHRNKEVSQFPLDPPRSFT